MAKLEYNKDEAENSKQVVRVPGVWFFVIEDAKEKVAKT